jgi:hypothetical protein
MADRTQACIVGDAGTCSTLDYTPELRQEAVAGGQACSSAMVGLLDSSSRQTLQRCRRTVVRCLGPPWITVGKAGYFFPEGIKKFLLLHHWHLAFSLTTDSVIR